VAVLPFAVSNNSGAEAWFAEGIIEGIIHVLAGIQELLVISHGSAIAYAGREVDPRTVLHDLGVRYVLSGSVRRAGNQLRISAELAETTSGTVLRSDRYDSELTDLFDIQDQIATQVVSTLVPTIRKRELARAMRKHPDSVTAYDLVLQALDLLYRLDRHCFAQAFHLLQKAMTVDPEYAPAHSHAATWHMFRIGQGWSINPNEDIAEASRYAVAALERDRDEAVALAINGHMRSFNHRDFDSAVRFLDRAVLVGPSCHMAWTLKSATCGYLADGNAARRMRSAGVAAIAARSFRLFC
jgi:TolB-like protein